MDFFGELISKIRDTGFGPLSLSPKGQSRYSLHSVVRDQLGMAERSTKRPIKRAVIAKDDAVTQTQISADNPDTAYWDFVELREFLHKVTALINAELSDKIGRPTNAVAWSHDPARSEADILDLLQRLQRKHPDIRVPKRAEPRPIAKNMVQKRSISAAIANTFGVLVENGAQYGDLIETYSRLNLENEELLARLDEQVSKSMSDRSKVDTKSEIPRLLVVAYSYYKNQVFESDLRSISMCEFLKYISESNNFAGNSNETVVRRLERIIPS